MSSFHEPGMLTPPPHLKVVHSTGNRTYIQLWHAEMWGEKQFFLMCVPYFCQSVPCIVLGFKKPYLTYKDSVFDFLVFSPLFFQGTEGLPSRTNRGSFEMNIPRVEQLGAKKDRRMLVLGICCVA